MSNENIESVEDVLAEMRDWKPGEIVASNGLVVEYADRIEAAVNREREQFKILEVQYIRLKKTHAESYRNSRSLRAAAERLANAPTFNPAPGFFELLESHFCDFRNYVAYARKAVEIPPRNCDLTREEAEERFRKKFGRAWNTTEDEFASWFLSAEKGRKKK